MVKGLKSLEVKSGDKVFFANDIHEYGEYRNTTLIECVIIPEKTVAPFVKLSNGNFVWLGSLGKIKNGWKIDTHTSYITVNELLNLLLSIFHYTVINSDGEYKNRKNG